MDNASLKSLNERLARLSYDVNGGQNIGMTLPAERHFQGLTQPRTHLSAKELLDLARDGLRWRASHAAEGPAEAEADRILTAL